jgi:hypothetical protein
MDLTQIHKEELIPTGDDVIRKHLGAGTRIITYPDLNHFKTLKQLLPKKDSKVVLLYLTEPNSGHWTCLHRNGDTVEFFCSYGSKIDDPLTWITQQKRQELNTDYPKLTELFDNDTLFKKTYNPIDYQSERDHSIATCGKHVICRLKHTDLDLPHYHLLMTELKKKYKLKNFDDIVECMIEMNKI